MRDAIALRRQGELIQVPLAKHVTRSRDNGRETIEFPDSIGETGNKFSLSSKGRKRSLSLASHGAESCYCYALGDKETENDPDTIAERRKHKLAKARVKSKRRRDKLAIRINRKAITIPKTDNPTFKRYSACIGLNGYTFNLEEESDNPSEKEKKLIQSRWLRWSKDVLGESFKTCKFRFTWVSVEKGHWKLSHIWDESRTLARHEQPVT